MSLMDEPYGNGIFAAVRSNWQKWDIREIARNALEHRRRRAVFPCRFRRYRGQRDGEAGDLGAICGMAVAWRTTTGTPLGFFLWQDVLAREGCAILVKSLASCSRKNAPRCHLQREPNDLGHRWARQRQNGLRIVRKTAQIAPGQ